MALDPSIFGMANRPTVALENPMDIAMKQMAMQNQQMAMAKQQQEMQDAADFRNQTGMSPGMAKHQQELATAGWKTQEARASFEKSIREMNKEQRAKTHEDMAEFVRVAQPLTQAKTPQEFQAGVQAAIQQFDPDGSKGWAKMAPSLTPESLKQLTDATMDHKSWIEKAFPKDVKAASDLGKLAQDMGLDPNDPKVTAKYKELHPRQPLVQIGSLSGPDKQTAIDQAALAMVQGRQKLPTGRELADPILGPAVQRARQLDPTLSQSTIALRQNAQKEVDSGKIGQSNNSISTVLGHLGHLKEVFNRLPDRTGMKSLNWLEGKTKEMAPGGNPDLQEVYDLVEGIGPEMAKAYVQGGGTEGERHGWKERINPFRPMGERKASLNAFSSMLITKLNQNEAQYLKAFKGLSPNAMPAAPQLTEDAYNALKSIQEWTGKEIPGADKWIKRYEESNGVTGSPTYTAPGQPAPASPSAQMLPQAKVATPEDIQNTAKKNGKTFAEVEKWWKAQGGIIK